MDIVPLAIAVFIGNALTLAFAAACIAMYKKPEKDVPGWALAWAALPLLFAAAALYGYS